MQEISYYNAKTHTLLQERAAAAMLLVVMISGHVLSLQSSMMRRMTHLVELVG